MKPLWNRQRTLLKEHDSRMSRHMKEYRAWKDTPKKARGEKPEAPAKCEHPLCSDVTIEALADRFPT
jgi:hypothetical protein